MKSQHLIEIRLRPCHSGAVTANRLTMTSASIAGVLGEYNHRLHIADADGFAIIYGPNGVGKTKFLEVIHAMMQLDARTLLRIPFHSAAIDFSDGSSLKTRRLVDPGLTMRKGVPRTQMSPGLNFYLRSDPNTSIPWRFSGDSFEEWLLENTPWRPSEEVDLWEDIRDGELADLADLSLRYEDAPEGTARMPAEFHAFRERVSSYLIETQRLRIEGTQVDRRRTVHRPGPRTRYASKIEEQAAKMRSLMNDAQTDHSRITQQLDRTFPTRVLESSTTTRDVEDIRRRYEDQDTFRSRLGRVASVELADALSLPERALADWELRLLDLYLEDAGKKLQPFDELLQKVELLEDIINARLLRKRLRVTAKDGLLVQREPDNGAIDLDSLSSGEQHEIILMFDLLFNVPEGALVLIDEPEISLHVVWQMAFIPDVQRIADLAGFRFIVATHSPQIINDKWKMAIALGPKEVPFT